MIQQLTKNPAARPFRWLAGGLAHRWPFPISARLRDGRKMFVDLRSSVGRAIFIKGEFDPVVFEPLRKVLQPGGTFLDAGANIGYYSLMALRQVGSTGIVHAFEIDPRPLGCLRRTIRTNKISNLQLHEVALGKSCGLLSLVQEGDAGHSWVKPCSDNGRRVPVVSLDEWFDIYNRPKIDALKIDVEGFEPAVIEGARAVLQMQKPLVICEAVSEFGERHGFTANAACKLFESFGYETSLLEGAWSPTVVARAK